MIEPNYFTFQLLDRYQIIILYFYQKSKRKKIGVQKFSEDNFKILTFFNFFDEILNYNLLLY